MEQESLFEAGEELIEKVRKHWIVYVEDLIIYTLGCLLFIGIAQYVSSSKLLSTMIHLNGSPIAKTIVFFVILFWVSFFYAWTNNYFDVWYITNKHIIAANQKQIFHREIKYMELSRIQDVTFEKNGFIQTLLGYGKLKVESAGEGQDFFIEDICDVEVIARRIMELKNKNTSINITNQSTVVI